MAADAGAARLPCPNGKRTELAAGFDSPALRASGRFRAAHAADQLLKLRLAGVTNIFVNRHGVGSYQVRFSRSLYSSAVSGIQGCGQAKRPWVGYLARHVLPAAQGKAYPPPPWVSSSQDNKGRDNHRRRSDFVVASCCRPTTASARHRAAAPADSPAKTLRQNSAAPADSPAMMRCSTSI